MAFARRQHALEMNCGSYARWSFFYWAARFRAVARPKICT
jgi:hypothetical protein